MKLGITPCKLTRTYEKFNVTWGRSVTKAAIGNAGQAAKPGVKGERERSLSDKDRSLGFLVSI